MADFRRGQLDLAACATMRVRIRICPIVSNEPHAMRDLAASFSPLKLGLASNDVSARLTASARVFW